MPCLYAYDGAGHLSRLCVQPKANCASAPDQRFSYDGKGMRVLQEHAGGARTVSFYGQLGLLLEEDLSTGKRKEYIYAGGELIAHDGSDGRLYYHNDHLGSPVAASNGQGVLQWRAHFRPYGERQAEGGANVGSLGYTGHVQDAASGLVYAGARYYDPAVGRFLAIDPAEVNPESAISFNRYAYANNSPYRFVDPDGRSPVVAMEIAVVGALVLTGAVIVNSNGWSSAFPAHQGGGEVYGGSSIDPTISGPWHTGRPASGFNWPTWMSSESVTDSVSGSGESEPPVTQVDPRNLIPTQTKNEMSGSQVRRLQKDMEKNGYNQSQPIDAWQRPDGRLEIQDGHHRTEAAKKAGVENVPVRIWK